MAELIGIAAVVVVAWFAAGTIVNVRMGHALMRWMQGGFPVLGERTAVRWLGSSVVELAIREAKAPFAAATVVIFLQPRDLPWARMLGRRDTLIVRGVLRRTPAVELEVLDPASWSGREALPRVPRGWLVRESSVAVHHESGPALERAEALLALCRSAGLGVQRLSVRRTEPHFQLHVRLPDREKSARGFFETVLTLGEVALK